MAAPTGDSLLPLIMDWISKYFWFGCAHELGFPEFSHWRMCEKAEQLSRVSVDT